MRWARLGEQDRRSTKSGQQGQHPEVRIVTAALFKALTDPGRLRLLSLIASHPLGEVCARDLVTPLGLSQPTVSHNLKVLHDAGLLERERRGVWIYY